MRAPQHLVAYEMQGGVQNMGIDTLKRITWENLSQYDTYSKAWGCVDSWARQRKRMIHD